jgi:hypothetical protein
MEETKSQNDDELTTPEEMTQGLTELLSPALFLAHNK